MKKTLLILLFCTLGAGAQAQLRGQVGIEGGVGSGNESFDSPTGFGVAAVGEYVFAERIGLFFQAGYTLFRSGGGEGNMRTMIPYLGGLRWYFSEKKSNGIYAHGKFGGQLYKVLNQTIIPRETLLAAGGGIGWVKPKDISIEIGYLAFITKSDPKSFISIKAVYNF